MFAGMRLHRSPSRRRPVMKDSYDEAFGPAGPFCFGPCPHGEWDDPTWLRVEVDEGYMAAQAARLEQYAEQQRRVDRTRLRKRRTRGST